MNEFDLIVRFKSDEDSITLSNYIIDHLFEDKLFDNLQMWDLKRSEVLSIVNLQKENKTLSQRILKQQKTIGSLTDEVDRLKAQIGKMQNVGNCKHAMDCSKFNEKEFIYGKLRTCENCKDWEIPE